MISYKDIKIGIITPSGSLSDAGIIVDQAISLIQKTGAQAFSYHTLMPTLFCAGTIEKRAEQLQNILENHDVNVLWALNGGYGAMHLLSFLDKMEKPNNIRAIVGFSDITALNLYFIQRWNIPAIHANTLRQFVKKYQEDSDIVPIRDIIDLIADNTKTLRYDLVPINQKAKHTIIEHSTLIGGNLAVITTSLATPWQINAEKKIIFLEDIGERGYKVERMLVHMQQAGIFASAHAVIFGEFTKSDEENGENHIEYVIENFSKNIDLPVWCIKDCGHVEINHPLILGGNAKIMNNMIVLEWSKI